MDIEKLSEEQLAGQRLMVGFEGTELDKTLMFLIDTIKVGGLILFVRNLSTPDQIRRLCRSVQDYAEACGQPHLFIAIDHEGGEVVRLSKPFTHFPGNSAMQSEADAVHFATVSGKELKGVAVNMNMAPVLDVAPRHIRSVMEKRAFGADPAWVSRLGVKVIENLQQRGIMSVAKHFPGIGRTTVDSHFEMPAIDEDFSVLQSEDLIPFKAAMQHNVSGIMLSHVRFIKIDPDWPASLSIKIAKHLLRDRMGFDRIVVTDDLDMEAIQKHYTVKTVITRVLSADIDLALICRSKQKIEEAFEELFKGMCSSRHLKLKGKESVKRIVKLKNKYLMRTQPAPLNQNLGTLE